VARGTFLRTKWKVRPRTFNHAKHTGGPRQSAAKMRVQHRGSGFVAQSDKKSESGDNTEYGAIPTSSLFLRAGGSIENFRASCVNSCSDGLSRLLRSILAGKPGLLSNFFAARYKNSRRTFSRDQKPTSHHFIRRGRMSMWLGGSTTSTTSASLATGAQILSVWLKRSEDRIRPTPRNTVAPENFCCAAFLRWLRCHDLPFCICRFADVGMRIHRVAVPSNVS